MQQKTSNEKELFIAGPQGRLQAMMVDATSSRVGIICHPHPLYGGTMHNKVVTTISRAWQNLGLSTLRFNFRGIEKSEGMYAHGLGEVEDLFAVLAWVKKEHQPQQIWLGGFSFGSYVALRAATEENIDYLLTVAPPAGYLHFEQLKPKASSWLLIQGEEDELVSANKVLSWAQSQVNPALRIVVMQHATHFFHGRLVELRNVIEESGKEFLNGV